MQTQSYRVTETAGPKVADRVASAGDRLELTFAEASYELLQGSIVPWPAEETAATPQADEPRRKRG